MRLRPRASWALILLVSLMLAGLPLPVLAQGGTVLAVDPAQASVEVSGQREIHLLVTSADNLNAFDVQVEYDPALLSLARWEFGDLLSNLAVVKRDDLPGSFRLVATQLATPGVSGDGVLLKLFFSGKQTGTSAITITKAEFARSEARLDLPELRHGYMTVIPIQPTKTATSTPTATFTPTATVTLSPTATATLTPTTTATPSPSATTTATPSATATATPVVTSGITGTQTITSTLGSMLTAEGKTATPASTFSVTASVIPAVGIQDKTPAITQPEPAWTAAEGGEAPPDNAEQGGGSGSADGNGHILQKIRGSGPTAVGVILFIAGLLAIGAAAAIYSTRKERV